MKRLCVAAALSFCAAASHAAEKKTCQLQLYAEMPVTMVGTRPLISGTINGKPARFLADSGAFFSLLSRQSAEKHGLRVVPPPIDISVQGTGGSERVGFTKVKEFTLAGFAQGRTIENVQFLVGGDAVAGTTDGVIGQNVLGGADTEYDLANGVIRAFRAKDCKGALAYWAGDQGFAVMEIEPTSPRSPHLIGHAQLNGKKIRVMFDTGAGRSLLTIDAAARAGVEPDDEGVVAGGISRGLGRKLTENSIARFDTLDLGGEVIKNARLRIGNANLLGADMLLGADFFLSHRIYVASGQNKVYFTYNGGPVFDLRANTSDTKTTMPEPEPAPSPVSAESAPALSAAELRRRGMASLARRDVDAALADLDKAVELDAKDPENLYQRGMARLVNSQPRLAMSDFDAALALAPEHLEAHMSRGVLHLRAGRGDDAKADFDAALKLAPKNPAIGMRVAEAYQLNGDFEAAIEQLDAWISAYPKDGNLALALNARCWSRAMLGKEPERARADCDQALKKGSRNSAVLDSRGFVWLQLGELDKAISDYKAALKLQPKSASSLYGLGLAETKKGLGESGASNMKAALEIDPEVARPYRRLGLIQ